MFEKLFETFRKSNSVNDKKYYEQIKRLTELVKKVEKKEKGIWWQNEINKIRVKIWIEDDLTTINIKIVEETNYEFSLNFKNNKYTFIEKNWDTNGKPKTRNLDNFEENIELIFLDTIDKTIDYFSNELEKKKGGEKLIKEQNSKLIIDVSSSTKNTKNVNNFNEKIIQKNPNIVDAVKNLDVELVKQLINDGEDINQKDENGDTLLIIAVLRDNIFKEITIQKENQTIHKNIKDRNLLKKQNVLIELLLKSNADVYVTDRFNQNIMQTIESSNHYKKIKMIFKKYNYYKLTKEENDYYTKSFNNKGSNNSEKIIQKDYLKAIQKGDTDELERFIKKGADPNIKYNGCTLLYYTVYSEELEFTKFLLENGANPNIKNDSYVEKNKIHGTFDSDGFEQSKNKTPIDLAIEGIGCENIALEFYKYSKDNDKLNQYIVDRLCTAILLSEYDKIQLFLSYNVDLDSELGDKYFKYYSTILDFVLSSNFKILEIFLESNPTNLKLINGIKEKINVSSPYESEEIRIFNQGIFSAIEKLDIQLVEAYIKIGISLNIYSDKGETPLLYTVTSKNILGKIEQYKIIELLLKNGANVYTDNNSSNVLESIKNKKEFQKVKQLFEKYGYYKDTKKENEAFLISENKINPNKYENETSLLYSSIIKQNIEEVGILLKNGADVNLKNQNEFKSTPLHAAIQVNNIKIIDLLIKYGANKNTLITLAMANNKIDLAKYIIEKVKDFNELKPGEYDSPLYIAISKEYIDITQNLLTKGANPNYVKSKDFYEYKNLIPLKLTCEKQNFKIVKLLVENGADVNLGDNNGRTALFDAIEAKNANKDIIRYLIQNGADIHKEDDKGITPLSFAESSKKSLVKTLTESAFIKLDENITDKENNSFKELNVQVTNQIKLIKKLQDEIKSIKTIKIDDSNKELKNLVQKLELNIAFKSSKIKELQNKLVEKEEETQKIVEEFTSKFEKLEKSLSMKQKTTKKPFIPDIQVKNKSVNQNNGVIVKRESFDDF